MIDLNIYAQIILKAPPFTPLSSHPLTAGILRLGISISMKTQLEETISQSVNFLSKKNYKTSLALKITVINQY